MIYLWTADQKTFSLSRDKPIVAPCDQEIGNIKKGDFLGGIEVTMPDDMLRFMRYMPGMAHKVDFFNELLATAKGLPSYNERFWLDLQQMLRI